MNDERRADSLEEVCQPDRVGDITLAYLEVQAVRRLGLDGDCTDTFSA